MPPKKDPSQTKKSDNNKEENKNGKKKKPKVLRKGDGMGGTIGLFPKKVKTCTLPCVTSFSRPPACCPQEMPMCCPTAPPPCPQMICFRSPPPCCPASNYM